MILHRRLTKVPDGRLDDEYKSLLVLLVHLRDTACKLSQLVADFIEEVLQSHLSKSANHDLQISTEKTTLSLRIHLNFNSHINIAVNWVIVCETSTCGK